MRPTSLRCSQSRWQHNHGRNPLSRSQPAVQTNRANSDQAYRAIDFDTIKLLLGTVFAATYVVIAIGKLPGYQMMIVVANLRLSGFFRLVSNWVMARAGRPLVLLMAIVLVAGSFSAFLVAEQNGWMAQLCT